jgi:heme/copper-type cytochrome/quinol oxidase subunit 3
MKPNMTNMDTANEPRGSIPSLKNNHPGMKQSENTTMMQTVVFTEAFFFLCLIMSYVYLAYNTGFEPHDLSKLDIGTSAIYTTLLIISSFTLHFAERGHHRGNTRALKAWLIITLILGAAFLIGQGREYAHLIQEKITLESSVFGASFFTLTGFHGLHVFIGLIILSIMLVLSFLGDFNHPAPPGASGSTISAATPGSAAAGPHAGSSGHPAATAPSATPGPAEPHAAPHANPTAANPRDRPTQPYAAPSGHPAAAAPPTRPSGGALGAIAIYWHFVDIVWIVVFTVVYVLPQFTNI